MAPAASTPSMTLFDAKELLRIVVVTGLSTLRMRSNTAEQKLISLWSTADKSLPRDSKSIQTSGSLVGKNARKSKARSRRDDAMTGSESWHALKTKPPELERDDAEKHGVRGAPNALELIIGTNSSWDPRKETLELTPKIFAAGGCC